MFVDPDETTATGMSVCSYRIRLQLQALVFVEPDKTTATRATAAKV